MTPIAPSRETVFLRRKAPDRLFFRALAQNFAHTFEIEGPVRRFHRLLSRQRVSLMATVDAVTQMVIQLNGSLAEAQAEIVALQARLPG